MEAYVHLSADERMLIFAWQRDSLSQGEMARHWAEQRRPSVSSCVVAPSQPDTCPTWRNDGIKPDASPISERLFIDARPPAANQLTEIGHWESDSLLLGHDQALNVLVERFSRLTIVTRLRGKTAQDTHRILIDRLPRVPYASVTADNGSQNADHALISEALSIPFFFCHPYHSWEIGTVENTNGLICCCLPTDTNLKHVAQHDLGAIAAELNRRPPKRLGFRTP